MPPNASTQTDLHPGPVSPIVPRMSVVRVSFVAGADGEWNVESVKPIAGEGLSVAAAMTRLEGAAFAPAGDAVWQLDGVRSFQRYLTHEERERLVAAQAEIGRPTDRCGVLIPIRKSDAWWALAQDER